MFAAIWPHDFVHAGRTLLEKAKGEEMNYIIVYFDFNRFGKESNSQP